MAPPQRRQRRLAALPFDVVVRARAGPHQIFRRARGPVVVRERAAIINGRLARGLVLVYWKRRRRRVLGVDGS